jgi:hypothetical protein
MWLSGVPLVGITIAEMLVIPLNLYVFQVTKFTCLRVFKHPLGRTNMTVELYQDVALTRDLPEHGLRVGDIATVVDFISHPNGGEDGYVLEIFNAVGESLTTIAVPISAVEALRSDEVLSVRSLVNLVA